MHDMLLDLSGMYVKSAQILASKGDFMPEPWCRRLAAMFDSMPPKPWAKVARVCPEPHAHQLFVRWCCHTFKAFQAVPMLRDTPASDKVSVLVLNSQISRASCYIIKHHTKRKHRRHCKRTWQCRQQGG